jgi:hypothetical protein
MIKYKQAYECPDFARVMLSLSCEQLEELETRLLRLYTNGDTVREIIAAAKSIKERQTVSAKTPEVIAAEILAEGECLHHCVTSRISIIETFETP